MYRIALALFIILIACTSICQAALLDSEALPLLREMIAEQQRRKSDRINVKVRHQNLYATNTVEGMGASMATSYDTSVYEAGLFRTVTAANGTVVSKNSRYPMTTSSAFTSNTWVDFEADCSRGITAGMSLRFYTMSDTDYDSSKPGTRAWRTGTVYGVMVPTGNFNGIVSGSPALPGLAIPGTSVSLWNAYMAGKSSRSDWKVEIGNLYPSMGKPFNRYLNMEHFLFRTPVSQISILGHWTRQDKIYSEMEPLIRMPGYGVKASGKTGKMNYEVFSLRNDVTPITTNKEYSYGGGRLGFSDRKFRAAVSAITSTENFTSSDLSYPGVTWREEFIGGLECEYDISSRWGLYGAVSSTRYREDGLRSGAVFNGSASVIGIHGFLMNNRLQVDLRQQYLDPDYEPLSHHKRAMYPTGYYGPRMEVKYTWAHGNELRKNQNIISLHGGDFRQVDGNINRIYGRGSRTFASDDYFFPYGGTEDRVNLVQGRMTLLSPEFNIKIRNSPLDFGGYYEDLHFWRDRDARGYRYDKRVRNLSVWMDYEFSRTFEAVLGMRQVDFEGSWCLEGKAVPFRQKALINRFGLVYDNRDNFKISAMYQPMTYRDSSPLFTAGENPSDNDWQGRLFLLETTVSF